jgi:hypothetical protein
MQTLVDLAPPTPCRDDRGDQFEVQLEQNVLKVVNIGSAVVPVELTTAASRAHNIAHLCGTRSPWDAFEMLLQHPQVMRVTDAELADRMIELRSALPGAPQFVSLCAPLCSTVAGGTPGRGAGDGWERLLPLCRLKSSQGE